MIFLKEQEARAVLNIFLGVKVTFLSDIFVLTFLFQKYKMNAILSKLY